MATEAGERGRAFECVFRGRLGRSADVGREARVMLGVSRRGVDGEDVVHVLPARALAFEDTELVIVAAVAGNRIEHDVVAQRGVAQVTPRACGVDMQPERTAEAVGPGECQRSEEHTSELQSLMRTSYA